MCKQNQVITAQTTFSTSRNPFQNRNAPTCGDPPTVQPPDWSRQQNVCSFSVSFVITPVCILRATRANAVIGLTEFVQIRAYFCKSGLVFLLELSVNLVEVTNRLA